MKKKKVARARRMFCQLAAGKMAYPGAKVVRYLKSVGCLMKYGI